MTLAKIGPKRFNGTADFRATPTQIATLKALNRRNPDGTLMDIYQLMAAIRYKGTRQGMSYVLGHLAARGMIEPAGHAEVMSKTKGPRKRCTYQITDVGRMIIRPRSLPGSTP